MKPFLFQLFSYLGVVSGIFGSLATAQSAEPKGLIVYKSSGSDSDERAMSAEYTEIKLNPKIVNGRKVDGSVFGIVSSKFVDFVEYPDLKRGVFRSPEQIETFKVAGRKMVEISEKFSSSRAILGPRIEEMKIAAGKFGQGLVMVNGGFITKDSLPDEPILPEIPVTTVTGEKILVKKILGANQSGIKIIHNGGVRTLLWLEVTESSKKELEAIPEVQNLIIKSSTEVIPLLSEAELLSQDQFATFAFAVFGQANGRRMEKVPQLFQGTWEIMAWAKVRTLREFEELFGNPDAVQAAVETGQITVNTTAFILKYSLSDNIYTKAENPIKISYIFADPASSRLCILAGDDFFVLDARIGLLTFFDRKEVLAMIEHHNSRSVTEEFIMNQPIILKMYTTERR